MRPSPNGPRYARGLCGHLRSLRLVGLSALLLGSCKGGEGLLLPSEGAPAVIEVVEGNGQSGRVGEPLSDPVVVEVRDSRGRPVRDATVEFDLTSPATGADVIPHTTTTDANGRAEARVVLGTSVGPQSGQASVVTDGAGLPPQTTFTAMALSESANGIQAVAGDDQSGAAGSALKDPLVVEVTDGFGNPIQGVPISWAAEGGGSVSQASTTTDDQGRASVGRTLGPTVGQQTTLANSAGLAGSPVTFVHTAVAGNAARLSIVSGNDQTAAAGTQLPADFVVQLLDAEGNPVSGTAVTWVVSTGGGSVTPESGVTDDGGRASARLTVGTVPGENRVDAVVSGVGVATFKATSTAGAPAALTIRTQPSSNALNGVRLGRQPVIQVRDAQGNDVATAGIVITAQIGSGGGDLGGTRQKSTDGNGRATFTDLVISGAPGKRTLAFTASGFAGATSNEIDVSAIPTVTTITGDSPDPSLVGATVTVQFRVTANGPTPTGSVTVSDGVVSCSGALSGGAGTCQLAPTSAGQRTLQASYSGDPGFGGSSDSEGHRVDPAPSPNQPPTSSFTPSCHDLHCDFTDGSSDSDGRIAGRSWTFGDGGTDNKKNPSHDYAAAGTYSVTLTVTDNDGATGTSTQQVTVTAPPAPNQPPTAEFTSSCNLLDCSFTDGSSDTDGTISTWSWDFDDGSSSPTQSPSHSYAAAKTYHVKLTVTDNGGTSRSIVHDVTVTAPPPPNQAPTAVNDVYSTNQDAPLNLPAPGVLVNDTDPENDALTATLSSGPNHGTLTLSQDGSFDYTPDSGFTGDDVFSYVVNDGLLDSNVGSVTITVKAAPPPSAGP